MTATPLTFLLGAGASFPYGVPMMGGFYSKFRDHLSRRYPESFEFLQGLESRSQHPRPDLETLLTDLQHVLALADGLRLLSGMGASHDEDVRMAADLRGYLDAFIVDTCERFDHERAARELAGLLALRTVAPLWVFTTNYDRIIEHACEQHDVRYSDGFSTGTPGPIADWTGGFSEDVRIAKLHGSVNWYQDEPGDDIHRLDRGYSLPSREFRLLRGDQILRPLMIIPTLEKQALSHPYTALLVQFTDVLRDTQVLVVAGNSLRDGHIRNFIRTRLPTLTILLIGPSAPQSASVLGCPERTFALACGFSEFLVLGAAPLQRMAETLSRTSPEDMGSVTVAIERFLSDASEAIQVSSVFDADPELARLLTEVRAGNVSTRVHATAQLGKHTHPAVVRLLIEVLENDGDPHVRVAAVSALVGALSTSAVDLIGEALLRDDAEEVQLECVLALDQYAPDHRVAGWLSRARDKTDLKPAVRSVIADVLSDRPK